MPSAAKTVFDSNITRVDDVLSFHDKTINPAKGTPPGRDRSLVLGAIALVYASWEAYIEQVAIEVVDFMATHLDPADVPVDARDALAEKVDPWGMAGDGWRHAWKDLIELEMLGDGSSSFGLNNAKPGPVITKFKVVGLDPFLNVKWQKKSTQAVKSSLNALVELRGQVVHTATAPKGAGLKRVRDDKDLVTRVVDLVDKSLGAQASKLVGHPPW